MSKRSVLVIQLRNITEELKPETVTRVKTLRGSTWGEDRGQERAACHYETTVLLAAFNPVGVQIWRKL